MLEAGAQFTPAEEQRGAPGRHAISGYYREEGASAAW